MPHTHHCPIRPEFLSARGAASSCLGERQAEEEEETGSQCHVPAAKDPCLRLYTYGGMGPK